MSITHIDYVLDESSRFKRYETLWKERGLALLLDHCDPEGKTLLDYGCGRGELLDMAKNAGFNVKGADLDPECLKLSGQYGPVCQLNPVDPLSQFGENSFDVITCFHVLEHVDNPKEILTAIGKIARSYVVLAVPNLRQLGPVFSRPVTAAGRVNPGHLQSWDHWHLLNLAENHCGLRFVAWGTDATVLPIFSSVSQRILGTRATIWLETGIFRTVFPYRGVSVLGLFRPVD